MKNTLSTRRKPGRARAKRPLRRSSTIRIAAVVDDSLAEESPTTTVRKGTRMTDPRVDAIAGSPVAVEDVSNVITGLVTEFRDVPHLCDWTYIDEEARVMLLRLRSSNYRPYVIRLRWIICTNFSE